MSAFNIHKAGAAKLFLIITFLFSFIIVSGQAPVDFSGSWQADLAKSDPDFKTYYAQMNLRINQTAQAITIERSTVSKDGDKSAMDPMVFSLEGKETQKEQYGGIDKLSASWSADKKLLKLKTVRTANGQDYGSIETWSMSPDGKVLTLSTTDLKGETEVKEVYVKQ